MSDESKLPKWVRDIESDVKGERRNRQRFEAACAALTGLASIDTDNGHAPKLDAKLAVELADELLAALEGKSDG